MHFFSPLTRLSEALSGCWLRPAPNPKPAPRQLHLIATPKADIDYIEVSLPGTPLLNQTLPPRYADRKIAAYLKAWLPDLLLTRLLLLNQSQETLTLTSRRELRAQRNARLYLRQSGYIERLHLKLVNECQIGNLSDLDELAKMPDYPTLFAKTLYYVALCQMLCRQLPPDQAQRWLAARLNQPKPRLQRWLARATHFCLPRRQHAQPQGARTAHLAQRLSPERCLPGQTQEAAIQRDMLSSVLAKRFSPAELDALTQLARSPARPRHLSIQRAILAKINPTSTQAQNPPARLAPIHLP